MSSPFLNLDPIPGGNSPVVEPHARPAVSLGGYSFQEICDDTLLKGVACVVSGLALLRLGQGAVIWASSLDLTLKVSLLVAGYVSVSGLIVMAAFISMNDDPRQAVAVVRAEAVSIGNSIVEGFTRNKAVPAVISGLAIATFCHFALVLECALCIPLCMSVGVLTVSFTYGEELSLEIMVASLFASAVAVGVHGILIAATASNPVIPTAIAITGILMLAQHQAATPVSERNRPSGPTGPRPANSEELIGLEMPSVLSKPVYFYNECLPGTFENLGGTDNGQHVLCDNKLILVSDVRAMLEGKGRAAQIELSQFMGAVREDDERRNLIKPALSLSNAAIDMQLFSGSIELGDWGLQPFPGFEADEKGSTKTKWG